MLGPEKLLIPHATSTYPCRPEELNLRMIGTLEGRYGVPDRLLRPRGRPADDAAPPSTLGACLVERHITLDRAMWGSDQAASVEPPGLIRLVRDIRVIEKAIGDGVKRVYESELPIRQKLRRVARTWGPGESAMIGLQAGVNT